MIFRCFGVDVMRDVSEDDEQRMRKKNSEAKSSDEREFSDKDDHPENRSQIFVYYYYKFINIDKSWIGAHSLLLTLH